MCCCKDSESVSLQLLWPTYINFLMVHHELKYSSFQFFFRQEAIHRNFITFGFMVERSSVSCVQYHKVNFMTTKPISACLCQIGLPNFSLQAVICYLDAKVCTIPMCLKQSAGECVSARLCVYTVCIAAQSVLQTTYLEWSKMFGHGV